MDQRAVDVVGNAALVRQLGALLHRLIAASLPALPLRVRIDLATLLAQAPSEMDGQACRRSSRTMPRLHAALRRSILAAPMGPTEPTSVPLPGVPVAYEALRRLARRMLRRWAARHRIGRTSLVHETYLRLAGRLGRSRPDEQHGLALAARAMRFVLIDSARRASTGKRTGADRAFALDDVMAPVPPAQLVALGHALDELAAVDPRRARIVELRAFGGMTVDEVAGALGVSAATVHREWPLAKAWLFHRLRADAS